MKETSDSFREINGEKGKPDKVDSRVRPPGPDQEIKNDKVDSTGRGVTSKEEQFYKATVSGRKGGQQLRRVLREMQS